MSLFTDYIQEISGITFEDPLDAIINKALEGGGGTPTPTPSQWSGYSGEDLRLAWRAGLLSEEAWKAELLNRKMSAAEAAFEISKQKQTGISTDAKTKGQLTGSEANKVSAIAQTGQAQINAGAPGAQAAIGLLGRLTGNPNMSLTNENGTLSATEAPGVTAPGGKPQTGGAGGSGTGASAPAKPASAPDWLQGWVDAFQGLSDDEIVKAYYAGEEGLDRNVLGALLMYRNTKTDAKGVATNKWSEASLNRYLDQIDADKPMGLTKQDIAAQFDPSRADFGAKGTFGSASLGQGIREEGLFTPNSGGSGLVPASDQSGNLWPAAAVVNNQLYTPEHVAEIARMRGMDPKKSTLADIGKSLQDQNFFMERYGADPSRANMAVNVASGAYNPANDRIDPASGRPAAEMNELELLRLSGQGVFRAQGGPVKAGRPYIVGENRPEVFVPEQNGTILPNAPRQVDEAGAPKERIPRQFEYGPIMRQTLAQSFTPFEQRLGDPRAGMIATANPRLVSENPRRYYMEALEPEQRLKMPWNPPRDQQMTAPGFPTPGTPGTPGRGGSLFEKALQVSMQRKPLGMMG